MSEQTSHPQSLLSVEIGSVNTRAHFFEVVEGNYRFLASGQAPSTLGGAVKDMNFGLVDALEELEHLTGRSFLSDRGLLVSADMHSGQGANAFCASFSGGPAIKVVTVGLLDSVSLESVHKLVRRGYFEIIESISLGDRRKPETIIDAINQQKPDLVVLGGGTNRGASRSVIRLANYLALALTLLPRQERAELLYVGNENLQGEIETLLGALTNMHVAANIRPHLDAENLGPAEQKLSELYYSIQTRKVQGMKDLHEAASGHLLPSAKGLGRVVRFLSTVIDAPKGMLGVDLGASHTTVAAAFGGELTLNVFSGLGMGRGLAAMLAETPLPQITRWLPVDIEDEEVLNYLYNKSIQPCVLPTSHQGLAIEQAAARQVMRLAIGKSLVDLPADAIYPLPGTVPWFDRILVSGATLSDAPRLEQSLMMVLDAIQPVGIASIILDQNNLAGSLGASAEINPLLSVQVLESNAFLNLGTVITPVGKPRSGSVIMRIQMVIAGEKQPVVEIEEGSLKALPLGMGKAADIYIQPLQNMDIGLGSGRGGWVRRVVGGHFGIVIDARGRPITVPSQSEQRLESLNAWQKGLGV